MNRKLLFVVGLIAASPAFADDVDLLPHGYVSAAIRAAQSDSSGRVAATPASITDAGAQPPSVPSVKSRAQIVAETREAARLGLLNGSEGGIDITPEQLRQIEQAGLRAVAIEYAATK